MYVRRLLQRNKSLKPDYVLKRYLKEATFVGVKSLETHFEPLSKKKPHRKSYLEALFMGDVDKETFTYPQIPSVRHNDFFKWLASIEAYLSFYTDTKEKVDKTQVLSQLRELEVFRTHIGEAFYGLELSKVESLKLIEVLSNLPWLGTYIIKNHILPVEIISKYASKDQKLKYFPKIMSGEMIPNICVQEDDHRTNINNIKSFVVQNNKDSLLLNGKKTYVVNGINSNLFLVFAKNVIPGIKNASDLFSLVLVERDFGGVTVTDVYETIGRHDTPICTINFEDTIVPVENVIGKPDQAFNILMEYLQPGKQNVTGQAISILRNFINQLVPDVLNIKHFDRELYNFDVVKSILGEMTFCLYTMESMAYLTAGMMDQYENQNAELEQTITETYCVNKCLNCIQKGIQLVGAPSYLHNKFYMQSFHDAIALTTIDTNNLDANTYIAAKLLQFLGKEVQEHVLKKRNFLQFPFYNLFDNFFDNNKSNIKIYAKEYLHPSLKYGIKNLEICINTFRDSVLVLLERSGSQAVEQYSDLHKISTMMTEIYAMFANLTRSSRSYCIGVRNADIEKDIGAQIAYAARNKIEATAIALENGDLYNGDHCYKNMADILYDKRKYALEHPLTRTF